MQDRWTDRVVRGPSAELLTADEFGELIRMSGDYVRDKVAAGEIPPPVKIGRKEYWTWKAVTFYMLRLELLPPEEFSSRGK